MASLRPVRIGLNDFADQPVSICGKSFRAHMSGALYWPSQNALIVSDLQFANGPAQERAARRETSETLRSIAGLVDTYAASTIIALGDGGLSTGTAGAMQASDRDTLRMIQDDCDWIWIVPGIDRDAARVLGGTIVPEVTVQGIRLSHRPRPGTVTHEVAGALHPAARLVRHGTARRRPCFVSNGLRLIMPAFDAVSGGLNVLDAAFEALLGGDSVAVWMLGQEGLYPVAPRLLRED